MRGSRSFSDFAGRSSPIYYRPTTGSTFLHRDLRDEKERAEEYKEHAEAEIAKLVKNVGGLLPVGVIAPSDFIFYQLRDTDAAQSDCQRFVSRTPCNASS